MFSGVHVNGRLIDVNNDTSTWLLDNWPNHHLLEGGSTRNSSGYEFIIKFALSTKSPIQGEFHIVPRFEQEISSKTSQVDHLELNRVIL
jgi:hypothetical protein